MKTLKILSVFACVLVFSLSLQAQTATTQTVLSGAITATQTTVTVASGTGFAVSTSTNTYNIWVDGELMKITASVGAATSGTYQVTRGVNNTRGTAHASGAIVFFGPAGASPFVGQNPFPGTSCTAVNWQYLPLINVSDGTLSNCVSSRWQSYNFKQWAYGHPVTTVADANYSATLADEFIVYIQTSTGRTVTLPAVTGVVGKTYVVAQPLGATQTLTIQGSANQGLGSTNASSMTMTATPVRLISVLMGSAYRWVTW